jgi:hypothetical protein
MDAVYEADTITPALPGQTVNLDPKLLQGRRPSYRLLSYLLEQRGISVPDDSLRRRPARAPGGAVPVRVRVGTDRSSGPADGCGLGSQAFCGRAMRARPSDSAGPSGYAVIPWRMTSRTHFACRFANSSELTFLGGSRLMLK